MAKRGRAVEYDKPEESNRGFRQRGLSLRGLMLWTGSAQLPMI